MMLRYRILQEGIKCSPWKIWRGELSLLPISAKTLFRRNGTPIDLLEISLRDEGYLSEQESLLEILKEPHSLKRTPDMAETISTSFGLPPEDWTEQDYLYHKKNRKEVI